MCREERPKMANLKWAIAYRFDEEADGYVLATFAEEMDQELSQPGEQVVLSTKDRFSESDLGDLGDDPSL
jgi:hypothetical protein